MDGTVPAGHEVTMGPGPEPRRCENPDCDRVIRPEDARSKRYCEPRCRTAAWKARNASPGVVAVRSFGPSPGDAQNGPEAPLSKRARELREQRRQGTVASDLRLQYARAVDVLADYLAQLNIPEYERRAHEVLARALPKGRRA